MDEKPYEAKMSPDFHPWRRDIKFLKCEEVSIKNLINDLSFIKDKQKWGFPFRRGMFEIPKHDFLIIADVMGVEIKI
jgi:predicted RNA-binding protein